MSEGRPLSEVAVRKLQKLDADILALYDRANVLEQKKKQWILQMADVHGNRAVADILGVTDAAIRMLRKRTNGR